MKPPRDHSNDRESEDGGRLVRLILWPGFSGAEWQLPLGPAEVQRCLVGWKVAPAAVDAGPPPAVALLLAAVLCRTGPVTFASALAPPVGAALLHRKWRLGRHFEWKTTHDANAVQDAADGIFDAGFFSWTKQAQVVVLSAPGPAPSLDERHLEVLGDPAAFADLPRAGAVGVLLPGVDGDVAGLYFFTPAAAQAFREELARTIQQAGAEILVATGDEFRHLLRA